MPGDPPEYFFDRWIFILSWIFGVFLILVKNLLSVSFLFFTFSFEYCTIAQMSNSNCSKKLATFESGGSALIKHFSLKRATYYLDQFSSFVGEISSFVFIDDYAYMLNFRNPDNFPAILNIYRLNVKSKNQSCKCTFCEITSHCTKLSRSHLSG